MDLADHVPSDLNDPDVDIPGYEVFSLIGEGGFGEDGFGEDGFGEVYHCREVEGLKRDVSIKLIRLGMGTREILARFDAEMHALARIDHANVARVIGSGSPEETE